LNGYVRGLADDPDSRRRLDASFVDPTPLTAAEFTEQVTEKWKDIVRAAGASLD
jgi:hypothetical protein